MFRGSSANVGFPTRYLAVSLEVLPALLVQQVRELLTKSSLPHIAGRGWQWGRDRRGKLTPVCQRGVYSKIQMPFGIRKDLCPQCGFRGRAFWLFWLHLWLQPRLPHFDLYSSQLCLSVSKPLAKLMAAHSSFEASFRGHADIQSQVWPADA